MKVICSLTKENEFGKGGICCVFTGPVPPKHRTPEPGCDPVIFLVIFFFKCNLLKKCCFSQAFRPTVHRFKVACFPVGVQTVNK